MTDKDLGHVIGGYKAAIHNPNVSDNAKEHAQQVLKEIDPSLPQLIDGKDAEHVLAGHKANLTNPSTSLESKEHSAKVLKQHGITVEEK